VFGRIIVPGRCARPVPAAGLGQARHWWRGA
jgi:hypothetical protein